MDTFFPDLRPSRISIGADAFPLATARRPPRRSRSERAEWLFHRALAGLGLILFAPLFALVAIAVKLSSPGPVLYAQIRVGIDRRGEGKGEPDGRRKRDLGGAPFTIIKFRTMYVDAEAHTGEVWAAPADVRVTPIGRFLRRLRLDELPQLVNVVRGEMNLVGPRPERPGIFAALREQIPEYPQRQRARPGITGLAQISRCYDTCLEDVRFKVRHDLEYLRRQGVGEDLRILLRTVPVVLFRRGGW